MDNMVITPELVNRKLKKLNQNKSSDTDEWHPYFLQNLFNSLSTPLAILFSKSLTEGAHFTWRKAVVTPV